MYCNNCGAQITDHSKFCSHCGAKTDPRASARAPEQTYRTLDQPARIPHQVTSSQDTGFLICGIILFVLDVFWAVFPKIVDNWYEYRHFTFPLGIIGYGMPILFAIFTKRMDYKVILCVIGGILVCWSIVQNVIEFFTGNNSFNF